MNQEHYGAISMIALFAEALLIESLPVVSVLCFVVAVFCFYKGELWEMKEERSDKNERNDGKI